MAADDGGGSAADFEFVGGGAEKFAECAHGIGIEDGVADARCGGDEGDAGFERGGDVGARDPGKGLIGGEFGGFAECGEVEARRLDHRIDEDAETVGIRW
jgi:hypothetical protein